MTATTTTKAAAVNYTAEQTVQMLAAYTTAPTKSTVEALAVAMGKTTKSIIAKLCREKVYVKAAYVTKTGEASVKKDAHADAIGAILLMTEAETESLTKANKTALVKIFKALANSKPLDNGEERAGEKAPVAAVADTGETDAQSNVEDADFAESE